MDFKEFVLRAINFKEKGFKMKKIFIILVISACAIPVVAGNPDARTSIELFYGQSFLDHNKTITMGSDIIEQKDESKPYHFGIKLISPNTDNFSIILSGGFMSENITYNQSNALFNIKNKINGTFFNIGLKFYLSGEKNK